MKHFWNKIEIKDIHECWPWTAALDVYGYGQIARGPRGKQVRFKAHRIAYELMKGPIADGALVLHSCDRRECCNPMHLRQGTYADNGDDMRRRKRSRNAKKTACPRGHAYDKIIGGRRRCGECDLQNQRRRNS